MQKNKKLYAIYQKVSAIFMVMTLLWLTISTPFVFACQQELAKQDKSSHAQLPLTVDEEEAGKPLSNTAEEKTPGTTNSLSEEYLHEQHGTGYFYTMSSNFYKHDNADTYHAYHGELLVPPPNSSVI